MKRRKDRIGKRSRTQKGRQPLLIGSVVAILLGLVLIVQGMPNLLSQKPTSPNPPADSGKAKDTSQVARIMASGDLIYHEPLYLSAQQADGSYNFSEQLTYIKPWVEQADLALVNFEGTISPDQPLIGYPQFNAPSAVANALQETGYDVIGLGNEHILDTGLPGLVSTATTFADLGLNPVGVYPEGNRPSAPLLIREVNGIKIAILAYSQGFNEQDSVLSQEERDGYLSDLNQEKIQAELERAEKEADITIVLPQMGTEYQLEPTVEQQELYRQMVAWGADLVLGGHPHVVQPAETIEKDGQKKLIVYSLGNFLSNQGADTVPDEPHAAWTERGLLMDITIEKKGDQTNIQTAQARPTWVSRVTNGRYTEDGRNLYDYHTYVLEDVIEGGQHRDKLDEASQQQMDTIYQEVQEQVNLQW